MEGTPFGRYRLIEVLGRGGMGEVWRAHDTDTDRIVAIKLLPAHLSEDEEFQRRFRREAHAAARLNTPHVVPIHNYGEIDGRLYVDMRLIEGRDLDTVLADGPLEPVRAVRIIDQVANALHAAHQVGLLHRDIKPSNILLDHDDFAYLIDFGIARAADETRMTKSGNTIGTFAYIAPERLDSRAEEDARADIYSLACVLYEALTGEPPFPGTTTAHLMYAHCNTPPPRPSTTQSNLPALFDAVIAKGMAKGPDQRYATTVELAAAAREAITEPVQRSTPTLDLADTEPTAQKLTDPTLAATQQSLSSGPSVPATESADRPSAGSAATPWSHRHRPVLIAAVIAILLSASIITGRLLLQQPNSHAPRTSAAQPPTRVTEAALDGLLLSPDQINTSIGTTGMEAGGIFTNMPQNSLSVSEKACLPLNGPADANVYAGSGWSAVRWQDVVNHPSNRLDNFVIQAVVLFSSAQDSHAFLSTSAQSWPACRQYTHLPATTPAKVFTVVGPIANVNGTLSATIAVDDIFCQRALTVANNIAIDVEACKPSQSDPAVNIAHQIAAKVPTT